MIVAKLRIIFYILLHKASKFHLNFRFTKPLPCEDLPGLEKFLQKKVGTFCHFGN